MPARIVLPGNVALAAQGGDGKEGQPLDLEAQLRRAASEAAGSGVLDVDTLEAVACVGCEALEGVDDVSAAEAALRESLLPLLGEAGLGGAQQEAVLKRLLVAADVDGTASKDAQNAVQALQESAGKVPGAKKRSPSVEPGGTEAAENPQDANGKDEKKRFKTRKERDTERAQEYIRERGEHVQKERQLKAAREHELAAYYAAKTNDEAAAEEAEDAPAGDSDSDTSDSEKEEDDIAKQDREETKAKLRALGEVATFFGETDRQRRGRLKKAVLSTDQNELASGSTNVMQILDRRAAKAGANVDLRDDEDYEGLRQSKFKATRRSTLALPAPAAATSGVSTKLGNDDDSDDEFPWEDSNKQKKQAEQDAEAEAQDAEVRVVALWIRASLRDWEASLNERQKAGKDPARVLADEKAHFRQSKQYLRPLRKQLQSGEISHEVVAIMAEIARDCEQKQYKEAKEAYMRLAIGNHAWPMGITMVTFHDRPNRHMISEGKIAHVLNDETTRKYVQMVKRLVSFCEAQRPAGHAIA
eukprot:TRINITY_DN20958_c0_g4_i1.p1 TRINITY_DN20958_c0_g4~~TRINITY_DN20958_c0_g4_i1.p1  ORF type:complete len:530 (+),score=155.78 TRINITY_DN20958_c0_g4_i1:93-1682(+)